MHGRARQFEATGNLPAARLTYQALVRDFPSDAIGWLRLSALDQRADRFRSALFSAGQAAEATIAGRAWRLLPHVSMRLVELNELTKACSLIEAADWEAADVLREAAVLSQHLWLGGRYEAALRLIDTAQRRAEPSHRLAYSRAVALRHLGRSEDAADALEHSILLAHDYAPAHWSLAYHAPARLPGSRVARIRDALVRQPAGSPGQIELFYALYRELEAAGETERAWDALVHGASVKRLGLEYHSRRAEHATAGLRTLGNQGGRAYPPRENNSCCVFVVGLPRTGTTLLERVLGNHADVSAAGELNDFHSALCWVADRFVPGPEDPAFVDTVVGLDLSEVGARYIKTTACHRASKRVLVDKNPANFLYAGLIAGALPSARIVCLVRDPMDACFSNLKELFAGSAYPYSYNLEELGDYYVRFERMRAHWEQMLPGQFMSVGYEDLVNKPVQVTADVLTFCDLTHQAECERIEDNAAPVATASCSQVREPIHRRHIGAWRVYARQLEPLKRRLQMHGIGVDDEA